MNCGTLAKAAIGAFYFGAVLFGQSASTKAPERTVKLIDSIQGPDLYRAYCASCHGSDAKGNGPLADYLKVHPGDLTRISIRNGGTFPLMRLQRIISGEETLPSGHGSREMPVWGPIFSAVTRDVDLGRVRIDNLARYLRDIQVMK
jgi:mono/diheme cytochrome c family protein